MFQTTPVCSQLFLPHRSYTRGSRMDFTFVLSRSTSRLRYQFELHTGWVNVQINSSHQLASTAGEKNESEIPRLTNEEPVSTDRQGKDTSRVWCVKTRGETEESHRGT